MPVARTLLASAAALALLVAPAAFASTDVDSKIQPGALVTTSLGQCSLNFVFSDASGTKFIGTAGHCVDHVGERAEDLNGRPFATAVFNDDSDADFALLRVDADKQSEVQAALRHWGGPTGLATAAGTGVGDRLAFYGYGLGFSLQEKARSRFGVLVSDSATGYSADMPAVNGDSGAPIILKDSGLALGIVSHYGTGTTDAGPTVAYALARMHAAGLNVNLETAALTGTLV